jgi:hypothetical protein
MRRIVTIGLIIAVFIIAFFAFQLIACEADWKIAYIYPKMTYNNTETTKSFFYDYPPENNSVPYIVIGANGVETGLPLFSLTITYNYNDTLAVGVPFFLTASGSIYPEGQQTISEVDVGYTGSSFADNSIRNYPPTFAVNLTYENVYTEVVPPNGRTLVLPIEWNTEGEYYPYLHIIFGNGSSPIDATLPTGNVYVSGANVLQEQAFSRTQEEYNKVSSTESLDGVILGVLSPASVVGYIFGIQKQKTNQTVSDKTEANNGKNSRNIPRHKGTTKKRRKKKR